jgi:hypothetical protein
MSVPGIAAADEDALKGMTYADASALVAKQSSSAKIVIQTVVGSLLQRDNCTVSRSKKTEILDGTGKKSGETYLINLDCNGVLATAGTPGGSAVSPEGKPAKEKQQTLEYLNAHPDWCNETAENHKNCANFCNDQVPGQCTFKIS